MSVIVNEFEVVPTPEQPERPAAPPSERAPEAASPQVRAELERLLVVKRERALRLDAT